MIEVTPTPDLIPLYREWANEDPIFAKAAEFLEKGYIENSKLNWNRKVRDRLRDLRRTKDWDEIYQLCKKNCSLSTLKRQMSYYDMEESTARNVYYCLK
jgi:hypothetical protein